MKNITIQTEQFTAVNEALTKAIEALDSTLEDLDQEIFDLKQDNTQLWESSTSDSPLDEQFKELDAIMKRIHETRWTKNFIQEGRDNISQLRDYFESWREQQDARFELARELGDKRLPFDW